MRCFGLMLIATLALTSPIAAQAQPLGSPITSGVAGPAPGVVKVQDGYGPRYHPMPRGWDGDWRQTPAPSRQWSGGGVSQRWSPTGPPSGSACCQGPGIPTYWVWGPSGGAFDYPFTDWRGPTGGWGNP